MARSLRAAILSGSLRPGTRLPSTRALASDLGFSRNTAEAAFAQLEAEGFLRRRTGDGSYVAEGVARAPRLPAPTRTPRLSRRGERLASEELCEDPVSARPFCALPDVEAFPWETWHRLLARRSRTSGRALLGPAAAAGLPDLREAIAEHLSVARGLPCSPAQVVVLTSSQQGLDLAARVLLDPGDRAWMEDPGYLGARAALVAAGAEIVPLPVDEQGLDVAAGVKRAPRARAVFVTPSHQFPTGAELPLERRLRLLDWARGAGAVVLEDDYDGEYRHDGRPLAALQALDRDGRVVYLGTFSKTLFPGLRLAYLVAPPGLATPLARARALQDGHSPALLQAALADFLGQGHYAAHLRSMRALYRARRDTFVEALARELPQIAPGPSAAGFHLLGRLRGSLDDRELSARLAARGVHAPPLSRFRIERARAPGLLLGYSAVPAWESRKAIATLRGLIGRAAVT